MCTRKTSLSLLLFFVSIIYFTIRKVNPLCEKNVLFAGRSSQNHASWTCYVYHHLFAAGRPLGRPLRMPRSGRFYELRVTRSDVVSLSLSPRSGI